MSVLMGIRYILDFGAVGNVHTNDAAAIQRVIDTCYEEGGGRVLVPAGLTQHRSRAHRVHHFAPGKWYW